MNQQYIPEPMTFYKNNISSNNYVPLIYDNIIQGYYIDLYGNIYSSISNKIMKPFKTKAGYKRICLLTSCGKRNFSIHRLVAYTFIINPNPETYTDVNHIDGDKCNNYYKNLEWCDNNQNKRHASINGLYEHGDDRYNSVYSDEFAIQICEKFQSGIPYELVYKEYMNKYPNSGSTIGSFIYKLYHRKTRFHITKRYNY